MAHNGHVIADEEKGPTGQTMEIIKAVGPSNGSIAFSVPSALSCSQQVRPQLR
jgi:hypothetical protein